MGRTFGLILLVFWALALTGQTIGKGNVSLGGQLAGRAEKYKVDGRTDFFFHVGISPEYFLADRWSVGLEGGIEVKDERYTGKKNYLNVGIYTKYFVFSPLIFTKLGYQQDNQSGRRILFSVGLALWANERFSVDPYVEYARDLNPDVGDHFIRGGLGFRYYITNKK